VVIITKTNLQSQKVAHVILFSSDLTLSSDTIIDYDSLRFHIEFTFRDAKQYWGLEDFMNVSQTAVTNAANISLFMVNVTYCCLQKIRRSFPEWNTLDLKTHCRGVKYVEEVVKLLPEKPDSILLGRLMHKIAGLGCIHPVPQGPSSPSLA